MSTIPTSVTQDQLDHYIRPALGTAKRGFESKIPLFKVFNYVLYHLHTGCQWYKLPIQEHDGNKETSWQSVYYYFRWWSRDGSLKRVFEQSIAHIRDQIDTHHINLDGSHAVAKKGGEAVAYQGRKKVKLATTGIISDNHNDAFELKDHLRAAFKFIKRQSIVLAGSYFNADAAFDTKAARWTCFNHKLIPNIVENVRSRKRTKRGRKRYFDAAVYKKHFTSERSFAWIDKFRALLLRFDRKAAHFLGAHYVVFAFINLRHLFAFQKV